MLKVAVFVSGSGTNLQAIINSIESGQTTNASIELVISNNEGVYALERAKKAGIESIVLSPNAFTTKEEYIDILLKRLEEKKIDLIVLAGYLPIIPKGLVDAYPNKIINVHPSLIPSFCGKGYYGLKVHEAVLERGVKITGATVHFVDEGTDTGPIIIQKEVYVAKNDTKESLQLRVMEEAEFIIMPIAIHYIANDLIRVENNKVIYSDSL